LCSGIARVGFKAALNLFTARQCLKLALNCLKQLKAP
jgi:hypothetical protein